ncbi:hypothetical protein LEP1GSC170_3047 [Leptospira interrogans serovar Bataviae str. HAI135]|nr:hypothetical protein LEP1GSC170_3047 [Leptospira interrogans serovar Bataviae str. HAI135]
MELIQIEELNKILSSISGQNRPHEIFVDNLHTAFLEFKETLSFHLLRFMKSTFQLQKNFFYKQNNSSQN